MVIGCKQLKQAETQWDEVWLLQHWGVRHKEAERVTKEGKSVPGGYKDLQSWCKVEASEMKSMKEHHKGT